MKHHVHSVSPDSTSPRSAAAFVEVDAKAFAVAATGMPLHASRSQHPCNRCHAWLEQPFSNPDISQKGKV